MCLRGLRQPAVVEMQDYEIRGGTGGLTNPLLDCEVSGYRRGRELRPFKREIVALVDRLIAENAAQRISLYFRDLDNGPFFGIREEESFTGASLLKVPTIVAVLLQAGDNPGLLTRMVRFEGYPDEELARPVCSRRCGLARGATLHGGRASQAGRGIFRQRRRRVA